MRGDGAPPLQLAEEVHVETGEAPAIAGVAVNFRRLALVVADEVDPAALGEQVEDALFGAEMSICVDPRAPQGRAGTLSAAARQRCRSR